MAGHSSSSDDDNIWPGYVDALTTMTMVMTLIMMILGITVFGLSQGVSRQYIERIAEAAKLNAGAGVSTQKMSDDLVAWVRTHALARPMPYPVPGTEQHRTGEIIGASDVPGPGMLSRVLTTQGRLQADEESQPSGPNAGPPLDGAKSTGSIDPPPPFPMRPPGDIAVLVPGQGLPSTVAAEPKSESLSLAGLNPRGPLPADAAGSAGPAAEQPDEDPTRSVAIEPEQPAAASSPGYPVAMLSNPVVPAPPGAAEPPPPATASISEGRGSDASLDIVSRQKPDSQTPRAGGEIAGGTVGRPSVTIRFADGATRLDDEAARQLRQVVTREEFAGANRIAITGMAAAAASTVSDARRAAYYRVIAVREALAGAGMPVAALRLGILDSGPDQADTVTVVPER